MHSRGHSFIQLSRNFVRMLLSIKSEPCLKLVHVRSKTRLLGQILDKVCVYSRGHHFDPIFVRLFLIHKKSRFEIGGQQLGH